MSSQTNLQIERAERRSQEIRPATLIFGTASIKCCPGNYDFFERLTVGGFQNMNNLHVKILRCDIPKNLILDTTGAVFKRGQSVQVRNEETKDVYPLIVGRNNSAQSTLIILNLETVQA